ncbi:SGNH/GDSL hydrolase family protein [Synechocystis sp. PCC 7509]|uniref:SGNH/GDSL hydrolase family protein n=1 Tax=Synechocystis sp. PCC 7509 TaxID=927677 RepID=UPI0002ABD318|nr:SGNH/GDSL hydrolase family protein [Synechocystis sp. PCC 7509]
MQKQFLATSVVFLSFFLPLRAFAVSFTDIYVFGDSLSDTGNLFTATGGAFPPSPPYSPGRASNDRLWIEYLTEDLGANTTNYAFAGATTGSDNTFIPGLIGLQQQITNFQATNSFADPNALYVVWAGSNDYLGAGITDPSVPVSNLASSITSLAASGAENFLVLNLPDLGQLPATNSSVLSSSFTALTDAHNTGLDTVLNSLSLSYGIDIYDVDVSSLFASAIAQPDLFGFTNVTDACLTDPSCQNPNEYLFWDDLHPTTAAHEQIGNLALTRLSSQPIPEPSSGIGILAFGVLGIGIMAQRKFKKITITR